MINVTLDYSKTQKDNLEAYITEFVATASEVTMKKVERQLASGNDNLIAGGKSLAKNLADSIKKNLGKDEYKSGLNYGTLKNSVKYIVGKSAVKRTKLGASLDVEMKLEMEDYGFALGSSSFKFRAKQVDLIAWMKIKKARWGMRLYVPYGKNEGKPPETGDDYKKVQNAIYWYMQRSGGESVSKIKDWFIPEQSDIDKNIGSFISGMNLKWIETTKELNNVNNR